MGEAQWYYAVGEIQEGPVTWERLRASVQCGKLQRDHLIWCEGTPDWVKAGSVEGLFKDGL